MIERRPLLLLSGSPACGKDAITASLIINESHFAWLKKHKISTRKGNLDVSRTYHLVSTDRFNEMAQRGEFAQHHKRYGRGYGVSWEELRGLWDKNLIPIIHNGKQENLNAFFSIPEARVLSILLLSSRDETEKRLRQRHMSTDADGTEIARRLDAYDEEHAELADIINCGRALSFHAAINTTEAVPEQSAKYIAALAVVFFAGQRV